MNKSNNKLKKTFLKGYVSAGEHLPSMRELAKDLQVSLITTKRAYEDLEKMVLLLRLEVREHLLKNRIIQF